MLPLVTVPGAVLIDNGQELGDAQYLPGDGPGHVIPRLVNWGFRHGGLGTTLCDLSRRLLKFGKDHPGQLSPHLHPRVDDEWWTWLDALGYGLDVDRDLLVYHRWR